jgi:PAS domain S-box-containing protein
MWMLRTDGSIDFLNDRWSEYTGLPIQELRTTAWQRTLHPEDRAHFFQIGAEALLSGQPYASEIRLRRVDGCYCWHLAQVAPVLGEQGKIVGWSGTALDIDERKRAEQARDFLAEASAVLAGSLDYETTLATVAHLAVPHLADWCTVDIVESGIIRRLAVAHIDPEKLALAHELLQRNPPDPTARRGVPNVLRTGQSELTPEIPDSTLVAVARDTALLDLLRKLGIVSSMIVPLVARNQVVGAISFISAESGRHFSESDLAHAEELADRAALAVDNARLYREAEDARQRLSFVAEASKVLTTSLDYRQTLATIARLVLPGLADYCIVDIVEDDGQITRIETTHVDPSKEAILLELQRRYPPNAENLVAGAMRARTSELMTSVTDEDLQANTRDEEHLDLVRKLNPCSWMIVPMIARGRLLGTISLVASDSGRHYTAAELHLAEELASRAAQAVDNARLYGEAQAAVREREVLLSVASHELKNPLAALLGYAQLVTSRAQSGMPLSPRDHQGLIVIIEQAERLNKMLDALLDLSRLEQGRLELDRSSFNLAELAQRMLQEAESTVSQHTLTITLPETPVIVWGDELRIEQVVRNLIGNAAKYSPFGGQIDVRVEQHDDRACISVQDQGIGIPLEARPRLFQRFYRAPNAGTYNIRGIGVGLYVVKEIMTLHGGTVDVQSTEGAGSTFTICLPLRAG